MPDTAANEALAHRWHMDLFQAGKLDAAEEILTPDIAFHVPGMDGNGVEEVRALATGYRTAFADLRIEHVDTLVAGDKVAIRWVTDATHQGDFQGVAPTGAKLRMHGIDILHLRDGRIAEVWIEWDVLSALQQMGAVSLPSGTA